MASQRKKPQRELPGLFPIVGNIPGRLLPTTSYLSTFSLRACLLLAVNAQGASQFRK
jgi:hypothetical protein